jgi:carbonic anhydrase/acetyltransferase-like protein (isoleucine patch superfamily)
MDVLLPPLAERLEQPAVKVRKKRASKHDFKDGRGRVFAHRHINGEGWVADTAKVADSVFVNKTAQVYHEAKLEGNVRVGGRSQVCGFAQLRDHVEVSNMAYVTGGAVLMDRCKLYHRSAVYGGLLCGATILYDDATVRNEPMLRSVTMRNKSVICGYANVVKTSVQESSYIGGEAFVARSTLRGYVTVGGNAQVMNSHLFMQSNYNNANKEPQHMRVVDFVVIADVEHLEALVSFLGHTKVIGGRIQFSPRYDEMTRLYTAVDTHEQAIFSEVTVRRYDEFVQHNVPPSTRAAAARAAMMTGSPSRPFNMNGLSPNRRVMSLEGAGA